ncbi:hypothetical protein WH50_04010 [Pokkaliibacter plantistimulans]|uniref:Uncharacterized protein n=1 Tax=Pokkaliibacter plantistimulans TaxID=1635171 RepID=A0ABX5M3M6_9GAMM|nr:hypothetical protein [Pokkaliibacter plantistimulans]PXF32570.1 hypothetical protein WH50_04010 [Pokkaliibacter plantistimulans]
MSILFSNLFGASQTSALQSTQAISQVNVQQPQTGVGQINIEDRPSTVVKISQAAYDALAQEQQQLQSSTQQVRQTQSTSPMVELKQLPAYLFQVNETDS